MWHWGEPIVFERLDSGQKLGMLRKQSRLALCCCTMLAFACNILLFQRQVLCFQQNVPWPYRTGNHIWLKETVRILDQSSVRCWYSPFSQACRELESLKENFASWSLPLSALGVAVPGQLWQVAPELPMQTPKSREVFPHRGALCPG